MATNPTGSTTSPLVQRVKNILVQPQTEWPVIAAEPSTIASIYRNYVAILAAIPPICFLIGMLIFSGGGFGMFRYLGSALIGYAVAEYLLTLVGVYALALVIEALAPSFGGTKDRLSAFKLAAYSWTPAWVAGILLLIPSLAVVVAIIALYGCYLLYLGLPILMKSPADKTIPYVVAAIVAGAVIMFIVREIAQQVMLSMMPAFPFGVVPIHY
jgi:hypothetical protein